ncbi:porin [Cytophagaceae bacterium ABcell3]|nr:porin [Cytophagaceae bacterium ABcell3]
MKKLFALLIFLGTVNPAIAQLPEINTQIFADIYYGYDAARPAIHERPGFIFNHKRHNEVNLNLGLIKFSTENEHYRANIGLMAGNYAQYNLAHEPILLRHVFEANAGVKLYDNLWLDAGILPSYMGFESAISSENLTLTRSLAAENSPYYISGASLSWKPDTSLTLAVYLMNGWQRIQRIPGNQRPHFGTQVTYSPSDKFTLNWSTFLGSDHPDDYERLRIFNNFYGIWSPTKKLSLIGGLDIGHEKILDEYFRWFTPVVIGQYKLSQTLATAIRAEYFHDRSNIIIDKPAGVNMVGLSINIDYHISETVLARLEGRNFYNTDPVFAFEEDRRDNYFMATASLAVNINKK